MIKDNFPKERESYQGGTSDGWCYHIDIWADNDEQLIKAVRDFLNEQGYTDVPLPKTAERLWWDYLKETSGGKFVWHPIIIYPSAYKEFAIELHIYNESYPQHLNLWKSILDK